MSPERIDALELTKRIAAELEELLHIARADVSAAKRLSDSIGHANDLVMEAAESAQKRIAELEAENAALRQQVRLATDSLADAQEKIGAPAARKERA